MNATVQVIDKVYKQADGSEITAHMIRMGDDDYLTVAEAAEAFGVAATSIRSEISRHGLVVAKCSDHAIDSLRAAGVIPLKTTVVNLLPRATVDELVRIINTDEAKAAYRQIVGEWREAKKDTATALEHMADSVRQAVAAATTNAAAAARSADLALEVNKRVDAIAAVVADVQQQANDSLMTVTEMNELQNAIYRCAGRTDHYPGVVMKKLKELYLPEKLRSGRTWKEIPRSVFAEAIEFLKTWEPPRWR